MNIKLGNSKRMVLIPLMICSVFSTIFGATCIITLAKVFKKPNNSPKNFKNNSNKKVVVCIGDSITQGTGSFNYVDEISKDIKMVDYEFVNAGSNGNLVYNALKRIDSVIALNSDYIIILLGTNDANADLCKSNAKRYMLHNFLPKMPTTESFEENLIKLVKKLKENTNAKIAIFSIPVIGEKIDSYEINKTIEYSNIIKKVSEAEGITYLPLNEREIDFIKSKRHEPEALYDRRLIEMFKYPYYHYIFKYSWDDISRKRGLLLTTDTIHQNSTAGHIIIELIKNFILEK